MKSLTKNFCVPTLFISKWRYCGWYYLVLAVHFPNLSILIEQHLIATATNLQLESVTKENDNWLYQPGLSTLSRVKERLKVLR